MGEQRKYYLGLDMGTTSVGWAVTDPQYRLLRAKGKDLWGVRLFSEASTSADRRLNRVSRRRRQRETARLGVLREYFADEIGKVDSNFFARLDDSKFQMEERREDNKQPFALFADENYTDKEYYHDYPTIFHLRKELLSSDEPHDVRLVYLALANMFKHRGHFLNASLDTDGEGSSAAELYSALREAAAAIELEFPESADTAVLEEKLSEKGVSKRQLAENVCGVLGLAKDKKKERQLAALICGSTVKLVDIFGSEIIDDENKKKSICFRGSDYEKDSAEALELIGDENFAVIAAAKGLHDLGLLSHILKGKDYLSEARVQMYEEHEADLALLKAVLRRHDMKAYNEMFRVMKEDNYSAYVGSVNSFGELNKSDNHVRRLGKTPSAEAFYKNVKAVLKKLPQDDPDVQLILTKIDTESFMPKQLTSSNGVIPNQVHARELKAILRRAENYLPFLREKDESGLSVSERIAALFSFQIPYYVGPLGQQYRDKKGYNVWAERIAPGKIYPWNLEEKIDVAGAAEKFIGRMVRHCTYLSGEQALPKQSLLYEKFQVLNELNNLKVNGEKLSVEHKQMLYHELFETGKKVTPAKLKAFLQSIGYNKEDCEMISGIDGGFHNSLTSVGKFRGVFGQRVFHDDMREMMEDIIFWGTIYGNDKKYFKKRISEKYKDALTKEELKRILGFKFEGWGNLSREFLQMEGGSKEDGVIRSLIGGLWETNDNLMELLSGNYSYMDVLAEKTTRAEKALSEWKIEDLDEMYLSAPVKRMVWQTLSILRELEEVLGCGPERIFVEMAREEGKKGDRKNSRKQKLLKLYSAIKEERGAWKKEIETRPENEFRSKKLYLYYLQKGRCMYTGEAIDLEELMKSNSMYDIDHIYPRHFIKDDSLENNLVLVNKAKNAHKSDHFPIESDIRRQMTAAWKQLKAEGLLSQEKYDRLTRKEELTDQEKAGFINRQLVETRQGTKAITAILQQAFPESEIVFSKAGLVADFRNRYDLYKVRCVNDLHHANDAYLNIVVGNTYFVKFTRNPLNFLKQAARNPKDNRYKYNMDKMFERDVSNGKEVAWVASKTRSEGQDGQGNQGVSNEAGTIVTVRKMMAKNSPLVTKLCREMHGGVTRKGTIWNARKAAGEGYVPVKMSDPRLQDVTRYGGFSDVTTSGYTLVEYKVKGKMVRSLEALPVYLGRVETLTMDEILTYFTRQITEENKGKTVSDIRICKKFIPLNSLVKYDGFYYYLGGKTGNRIIVRSAVQTCFDRKTMLYIKKLEKAVDSGFYEEKGDDNKAIITAEKNIELYHLFEEKYQRTIFKNKVGAIAETIVKKRNDFEKLEISGQCKVLRELVKNFAQASDTIDLSLIGEGTTVGKILISKKISNAEEVIFISQSPTGLYQSETDLLCI